MTRTTTSGEPMGSVAELPQLLDLATLAQRLSTSDRHIRRLVDERRIPFIRVGRFIRFEPAAIAAWLRESTSNARGFAS